MAPENTLAAFLLARELGADGFECDVHLSKDGVPVVIHDANLSRLTGQKRRVEKLNWRELSTLDVGSWFHARFHRERLLSLEQALKLCGPRFLALVEIKETSLRRDIALARVCAPLLAEHRARACSFSPAICAELRACEPRLHVELVVSPADSKAWRHALAAVQEMGLQGLAVNFRRLTRTRIDEIHELGLCAGAWTVNHPRTYARLAAWGIDVIETDLPQLSKNV